MKKNPNANVLTAAKCLLFPPRRSTSSYVAANALELTLSEYMLASAADGGNRTSFVDFVVTELLIDTRDVRALIAWYRKRARTLSAENLPASRAAKRGWKTRRANQRFQQKLDKNRISRLAPKATHPLPKDTE